MTDPTPATAPKKDKPWAWAVPAALFVLGLATDYNEVVVWLFWGALVWAFVVNPGVRARLSAAAEKDRQEKEAKRAAKMAARRTHHVHHHYDTPGEPRG